MRKFLIAIAEVFAFVLLAVSVAIIVSETDKAVIEKRVRNENLPTIKADWKGTPVDEKGRFVNA